MTESPTPAAGPPVTTLPPRVPNDRVPADERVLGFRPAHDLAGRGPAGRVGGVGAPDALDRRSDPGRVMHGSAANQSLVVNPNDDGPVPASTGVLVVDDHQVFVDCLSLGLQREPDLHVAGSAGTLAQAHDVVSTLDPDVVILDHGLPDGDGLQAIADLRTWNPGSRILVLTEHASQRLLMRTLHAGASGMVTKMQSLSEVVAAVRAVAAGQSPTPPLPLPPHRPTLDRLPVSHKDQALTKSDHEILALLAEGLTNAAMAERLGLTTAIVRARLAELFTGLGA